RTESFGIGSTRQRLSGLLHQFGASFRGCAPGASWWRACFARPPVMERNRCRAVVQRRRHLHIALSKPAKGREVGGKVVPIRAALGLVIVVGCGRTTLDLSVSIEGSGGSGGSLQSAAPGAHTAAS